MQQFSVTSEQPIADHMSDGEAQEVLRLHLEQTDGSTELSVADVAEAIRIPESDVRRLLAEVRLKREEKTQESPARRRKLRDTALAVVAAVVFLLGATAFLGMHFMKSLHELQLRQMRDGAGYALSIGKDALDGNTSTLVGSSLEPVYAYRSDDLVQVISSQIAADAKLKTRPTNAGGPVSDSVLLERVRKGVFLTDGVLKVAVKMSYRSNPDLPIGGELLTVPVYSGPNESVRKLVDAQRSKQVREALENISRKVSVLQGIP